MELNPLRRLFISDRNSWGAVGIGRRIFEVISHCISDEGKGRKLSQREFFKVKKDITLSDEGAEAIFLAKQRFLSLPQKTQKESWRQPSLTAVYVLTYRHIHAYGCHINKHRWRLIRINHCLGVTVAFLLSRGGPYVICFLRDIWLFLVTCHFWLKPWSGNSCPTKNQFPSTGCMVPPWELTFLKALSLSDLSLLKLEDTKLCLSQAFYQVTSFYVVRYIENWVRKTARGKLRFILHCVTTSKCYRCKRKSDILYHIILPDSSSSSFKNCQGRWHWRL